jgi:hypothetical protein
MIYQDLVEVLLSEEHIVASGQIVRASPRMIGVCDAARLLLRVAKVGTLSSGETIIVRPVFVDEDDQEYLDANTTYGTITIAGDTAPANVGVYIPYPTPVMGLKITGAGSLAVGTEIVVSARLVPIRRLMPGP